MIFLQKTILDTSRLGVIELTLFDCANPYPKFKLVYLPPKNLIIQIFASQIKEILTTIYKVFNNSNTSEEVGSYNNALFKCSLAKETLPKLTYIFPNNRLLV